MLFGWVADPAKSRNAVCLSPMRELLGKAHSLGMCSGRKGRRVLVSRYLMGKVLLPCRFLGRLKVPQGEPSEHDCGEL